MRKPFRGRFLRALPVVRPSFKREVTTTFAHLIDADEARGRFDLANRARLALQYIAGFWQGGPPNAL